MQVKIVIKGSKCLKLLTVIPYSDPLLVRTPRLKNNSVHLREVSFSERDCQIITANIAVLSRVSGIVSRECPF